MPAFGRSHSSRLRVSDYVVETETDFELFQGQIREVPHAGPLHGTQLSQTLLGKRNCVIISHGDRRARETLQKVLHLLLRDRGIASDADADARIAECNDLTTLQRWVARAVRATSASELFDD